MRRDPLPIPRDNYPLFFAFGSKQKFLSPEEAEVSSPEQRIRSVWAFLVSRVRSFQRSLKSRDSINFDAEDTLTELVVALLENDHEWNPERGKYITFAGVVVERELCGIRDRSRTVESPRNSSCRMREYAAEEEEGTLSLRRAKTANDIRRTTDGIKGITDKHDLGFAVECKATLHLEAQESVAKAESGLKAAIASALTADEASIVGRMSGLWGRHKASAWQIAFESSREEHEIRLVYSRAKRKIRKYLNSINHPCVESN